jgi:alkylation response protein AidB-like acyl-CoA dehydrogenase
MNFDDTPAEAAFRSEARAWLEANAISRGGDDDYSTPFGKHPRTLAEFEEQEFDWFDQCKRWQATLHRDGWAGITWPKEYGGRGGSTIEEAIFAEEQSHFGVSSAPLVVGIGMAGPTIIAHGTAAQRDRFLDPMLRGDEAWCQLFSEPEAGSDLANLATRAVLDGDRWIVNGQKVWTSGARQSDWGILLARTDPDQPKHQGITFFVVDMRTPGIDVRPLRQINGGYHFNEVFLTDVAIPTDQVIGPVNGGWNVTMTTLTAERFSIGGGGAVSPRDLIAVAQKIGRSGDPVVRQQLADLYIRAEVLRYTGYRTRTSIAAGRGIGPETSVAKLMNGQKNTDLAERALEVLGAAGMLSGEDSAFDGTWADFFLFNRAGRIGGGTDEVQRNIVAERVLGLPREPAADRGLTYRELHARG